MKEPLVFWRYKMNEDGRSEYPHPIEVCRTKGYSYEVIVKFPSEEYQSVAIAFVKLAKES